MEIAYLAQTEWSTLLLDAEGVCVQARARSGKKASSDGAARCIGAQYVASMDRSAAGGLIEMPRVGCPMVFAATTADGRIYLVRTGPVIHFEEVASGVHDRDALPLQERARTDERVVFRERVPEDQEMTTPFRKAAAAKRAHPATSREEGRRDGRHEGRQDGRHDGGRREPRKVGLPLPPPPAARQSYLPPPPPSRSPAPSRHSVPPPPTRRQHHHTDPEISTSREPMWSLPDEDLQSDRGPSPLSPASPVSNPYHLKRQDRETQPTPVAAPWPAARSHRRR